MGFSLQRKSSFLPAFLLLAAAISAVATTADARGPIVIEKASDLGIIKGVVKDSVGSPIADATVAIFRVGTSRLLKQVRSSSDGSFLAKILPGTYTVLAVAQGFNPVTVQAVEVNRSSELVYGFNLERAGSGNTLPEKRADRNSSKWRIRASQSQRSIYQNTEGQAPIDEAKSVDEEEVAVVDESATGRRPSAVVETYFASGDDGNYQGVNFATLLPISAKAEIVLAGQTGTGKNSAQRFETQLKFRPNQKHKIRLNGSFGKLGTFTANGIESPLAQFSFQAMDEWSIREGLIFVYGIDYSKFVGAGSDFSVSPRLGFQFDLGSKTRLNAAYTSKTEEKNWAHAIDLEDTQVVFSEPAAVEDLAGTGGKPQMNKSTRFELGVERVLDNNSSIEANVFFDTTFGRGVGLTALPFDTLGNDEFGDFVSNQQGRAQGMRVVYSRRIGDRYSTSAGYSFGSGQKLSRTALLDPANIFENGFFQSFFGEFEADLNSGTNVKTIFRLSPQATVFAIDPFQGRLAIYDPSLSVLVTQSLPNLGLPFHAEAIVDARNLFDFQAGTTTDEGTLRINAQRRLLRGGILVRF